VGTLLAKGEKKMTNFSSYQDWGEYYKKEYNINEPKALENKKKLIKKLEELPSLANRADDLVNDYLINSLLTSEVTEIKDSNLLIVPTQIIQLFGVITFITCGCRYNGSKSYAFGYDIYGDLVPGDDIEIISDIWSIDTIDLNSGICKFKGKKVCTLEELRNAVWSYNLNYEYRVSKEDVIVYENVYFKSLPEVIEFLDPLIKNGKNDNYFVHEYGFISYKWTGKELIE